MLTQAARRDVDERRASASADGAVRKLRQHQDRRRRGKEPPCVSSFSRLYWLSRSSTFWSRCASRAGAASRSGLWLGLSVDRRVPAAAQRARRLPRTTSIAALHGEQPLLRGLLDSGRKVLAGVLLILPGRDQRPARAAAAGAADQRRPQLRRRRRAGPGRVRRRRDRRRVPAPRLTRRPSTGGRGRAERYFIRSISVGSSLPARR